MKPEIEVPIIRSIIRDKLNKIDRKDYSIETRQIVVGELSDILNKLNEIENGGGKRK